MVKLVCISDTHMAEPDLPEGSILIHAGDALGAGDIHEWLKFKRWFVKQYEKFGRAIYTPGNHDRYVQQNISLCRNELASEGIDLLIDEPLQIGDISFWGSPWVTPINGIWAFEAPDENFLMTKFNRIRLPGKKKILITHSPPQGILSGPYGSQALMNKVLTLKPDLHIFGHVHFAHGHKEFNGIKFYNVAVMTDYFKSDNPITVIDFE